MVPIEVQLEFARQVEAAKRNKPKLGDQKIGNYIVHSDEWTSICLEPYYKKYDCEEDEAMVLAFKDFKNEYRNKGYVEVTTYWVPVSYRYSEAPEIDPFQVSVTVFKKVTS